MRTNVQRNVRIAACSSLLLLSALGAAGQGTFQNLDFEDTTITAVLVNPFSGYYAYVATVPGWTWSPLGNAVGTLDTVSFNNVALDSPAVTLHGTDSPYAPALAGNYSILLQGGSQLFPTQYVGGAWISQTGQIPGNAQSLIYFGGGLQVSFNGQSLSPIALDRTPTYTKWGVDISPYAGQTGELRFAVPRLGGSMLDEIQFSSSAVPEPSVLSLSVLGFALVLATTRWANLTRQPTPGVRLVAYLALLARRGCAGRSSGAR